MNTNNQGGILLRWRVKQSKRALVLKKEIDRREHCRIQLSRYSSELNPMSSLSRLQKQDETRAATRLYLKNTWCVQQYSSERIFSICSHPIASLDD
jgi:hypothetical protein